MVLNIKHQFVNNCNKQCLWSSTCSSILINDVCIIWGSGMGRANYFFFKIVFYLKFLFRAVKKFIVNFELKDKFNEYDALITDSLVWIKWKSFLFFPCSQLQHVHIPVYITHFICPLLDLNIQQCWFFFQFKQICLN